MMDVDSNLDNMSSVQADKHAAWIVFQSCHATHLYWCLPFPERHNWVTQQR